MKQNQNHNKAVELRELLREKIEHGVYQPGTSIPSENELAEEFRLSRATVRSAIFALEFEGLLQSHRGKGVFVSGSKAQRDMETLGGFRQTIRQQDQRPTIKILKQNRRQSGPYYGLLLDIGETAELWYIKRLCFAEATPVALEEIFIPVHRLPDLDKINLRLFSIMDIYRWHDITPARAEQSLSVAYLDKVDAKYLKLDTNTPVLNFSGIMYDNSERKIEFSRSYTRHDQADYTVHYQK